MKRQSQAILMAVALMVALFVVGWQLPVPYVILSPGSTVNVLGAGTNQKPTIQVEGVRQYSDPGQLRMVTVLVTRPDTPISLLTALWTWAWHRDELLPYDVIYPPNTTQAEETAQGSAQMVSSQDNAIAAAITALGYTYKTRVGIASVIPQSPSAGVLQARDWILAVDGVKIRTPQQVVNIIGQHKPGDTVTLRIERQGKVLTKKVTLGHRPDAPSKPLLGIYPGVGYDFPFQVKVNIDPNIGGPSAGLILSLAIYDRLTPGSLVGDADIAGTGTISADGRVGAIGGIAEKIRAAIRDGAQMFLVPPGNCNDVLDLSLPGMPRLVKAPTFKSALASVKAFARNPSAKLPECTR